MTKDISNENPIETIRNLKFCVFDLETTGGNHKSDKIIEIGLVRVENLEVVAEKDYLIKPEIKIPDFIQKLTNIKQDDVEDAPVIEEVIDEIIEFMGDDTILVAHNTSFDVPFFNSVLKRLEKPELENRSICTNLMTKYLIPNLLNSNLNYMCKIFDIKHKKAHRALDDASATAELLIKYLRIFIDKKVQKINHLYYPRNRYELDRVHFKSERDNEKEIFERLRHLKSPSLVTLKGENGVILFALPCSGTDAEKELIMEKVKDLPWMTTTIKLFGPFIETIVHFNNLYSKIDSPMRSEIMRFLWSQHIPGQKPPHKTNDPESMGPILERDFGDFLITNHLVPEQMLIIPLQGLHVKSQLIFRYPSHKKKLLQYINAKASRLSNNKMKAPHFHPSLKEFVDCYLKYTKEKHPEQMFIFKKSLPTKRPDEFLTELDTWLAENPNPYKYPKDYI